MLKLKDLLEVIEEGTRITIIDWSNEKHLVIYNKHYNLECFEKYDDYKVVSLEQNNNYIIINIMKVVK